MQIRPTPQSTQWAHSEITHFNGKRINAPTLAIVISKLEGHLWSSFYSDENMNCYTKDFDHFVK